MPDVKAGISPVKDFIAGGFSGICLVIAGHPFDTIKVLFFKSIINTILNLKIAYFWKT